MSKQDRTRQIIERAQSDVASGLLSRRDFLRLATLLGATTGASALLAACGAPTVAPTVAPTAAAPTAAAPTVAPTAAATTRTGTLRVALDVPVQLDPASVASDSEVAIANAIYDYLIEVDANNELQPRLATKWEVSGEGLVYTLDLASGVTFHDGSPFSPADVVWTFDRLRNPTLKLPTADLYANIESITAVGANQVVFKLKATNPFFPFDLSDNHALVLKANTADPTKGFNGTGPFKVKNYSPESRMDLVANEAYFIPGKPGVASLELVFFKDQAASVDALRGGQIDLATRMATPLFQALQSEPNITAVSVPTNGFDLVRLRADRAPGNNPKVMQALKLATDRQAIFETVTQGLGAIGRDSPIGPLFKAYYSAETPIPARDPVKAKALLSEAGFPTGLKLDLHVPDSGDRPDLAVILKEQWAPAGIEVNVIVEPESVYYGDNGWLDVDLGITGWGSRPTPQFYFDVMLVSNAKWNESHFTDTEFDHLAEIAGSTLNEIERIAAYKAIQTLLIERGPLIIPYFFAQLGAIRSTFTGFVLKAFAGRTDLAAIRMKS